MPVHHTRPSLHKQPELTVPTTTPSDGGRLKSQKKTRGQGAARVVADASAPNELRHKAPRKAETDKARDGVARKRRRAPEATTEPPVEGSALGKPGKPPKETAPKRAGKTAPDSPGKGNEPADTTAPDGKADETPDTTAPDGKADETPDTTARDGAPGKKTPPWLREDPLGFARHKIQEDLGGAPEKLYVTGDNPIRFPTEEGKDKSGWVRVYQIGKYFFIRYGDWRTGARDELLLPEPGTSKEKAKLEQEVRRLEEVRQRNEQAKHAKAQEKAQRMLESTRRAPADIPYLQRKGVQPHGARAFRRGEVLIVPLYDAERKIWNLQFIQPDGGKVFLSGGRVSGLFHPFGTDEHFRHGKAVLVCEGWATGATLHEATGLPVAAAMNCGNLLPVAQALKEKYPQQRLVICADDDWKTESKGKGNPGRTQAQKTASVAGAVVAVPIWSGERGEKDTDFNDLAKTEGLSVVRQQIEDALQQKARPGEDERPCYWVLEEDAEFDGKPYQAGVYYCEMAEMEVFKRVMEVPVETWLSSLIHLEARTIEWPDGAQGIRLSVWDGRGWRNLILPRETLASSRYRELLFAVGAQLTPKPNPHLVGYLQQDTAKREYETKRTGWHDEQYVLPETTLGEGATISFTGLRPTEEPLTAGTLEEWQQSVAAPAVGNSYLAFAISLAFVGPLLKPTGHDAVLVQLVGRSTTGKTTCLLAANSVVGPPAQVTTWRATANGLEQKALAHCDGFLALDEIGQVEPKVLDHAVYTLANGAAKQRATVYDHGVGAAPTQRWRVAALSTGEKTMETLLALDGRSVNAGQFVRLIEIPVDEQYGAFTELHGCQSPAELADKLREAVRRCYGTPKRAFLEQLVSDDLDKLGAEVTKVADELRKAVESDGVTVSAQAGRVLGALALIAAAGELATDYGVTGWPPGTAFDAVRYCYRLWAQGHPTQTDHEEVKLLRQLRDFITRHGDSRFSPVAGEAGEAVGEGNRTVYLNNSTVRDRAGYYRDTSNDREYLFTSDGLREAVSGFDYRRARQELEKKKVLIAGGDRDSQTVWIGGAKFRVYVISSSALNHALEQIGGVD